jgi:hypothetical protein
MLPLLRVRYRLCAACNRPLLLLCLILVSARQPPPVPYHHRCLRQVLRQARLPLLHVLANVHVVHGLVLTPCFTYSISIHCTWLLIPGLHTLWPLCGDRSISLFVEGEAARGHFGGNSPLGQDLDAQINSSPRRSKRQRVPRNAVPLSDRSDPAEKRACNVDLVDEEHGSITASNRDDARSQSDEDDDQLAQVISDIGGCHVNLRPQPILQDVPL